MLGLEDTLELVYCGTVYESLTYGTPVVGVASGPWLGIEQLVQLNTAGGAGLGLISSRASPSIFDEQGQEESRRRRGVVKGVGDALGIILLVAQLRRRVRPVCHVRFPSCSEEVVYTSDNGGRTPSPQVRCTRSRVHDGDKVVIGKDCFEEEAPVAGVSM